MEKIIDKLKKIKELADKGIAGEMQAAKSALEKLLKQYNLTLEDLSNNTAKERCFIAKNTNERAVLIMCGYALFGHTKTNIYSYKRERGKCYIKLTDYEYVELLHFYNFHRRNINREFEQFQMDFQMAYQRKHGLYTNEKIDNPRELDIEKFLRIEKYANEMQDVQYRKAIGS